MSERRPACPHPPPSTGAVDRGEATVSATEGISNSNNPKRKDQRQVFRGVVCLKFKNSKNGESPGTRGFGCQRGQEGSQEGRKAGI